VSELQGVSIIITQGEQTIAQLQTDSTGDASVVLNAGNYTVQFQYPGRQPISKNITIDRENTFLVFAFPSLALKGLFSLGEMLQTVDLDNVDNPSFANQATTVIWTNT
jgi:hypothetical protein